jgi:hypothetical protein
VSAAAVAGRLNEQALVHAATVAAAGGSGGGSLFERAMTAQERAALEKAGVTAGDAAAVPTPAADDRSATMRHVEDKWRELQLTVRESHTRDGDAEDDASDVPLWRLDGEARARMQAARDARSEDEEGIKRARDIATELGREALDRETAQARERAALARQRRAAHTLARSLFNRVAQRAEDDEAAVLSRLEPARASQGAASGPPPDDDDVAE